MDHQDFMFVAISGVECGRHMPGCHGWESPLARPSSCRGPQDTGVNKSFWAKSVSERNLEPVRPAFSFCFCTLDPHFLIVIVRSTIAQ